MADTHKARATSAARLHESTQTGQAGLAGSPSVLNFLSLSLWLWPECLIWVHGANSGFHEEDIQGAA